MRAGPRLCRGRGGRKRGLAALRVPSPAPLWRFIALAALVVVVLGSVVFARRSAPPDLKISARVSGTPTPTAERAGASAAPAARTNFLGSGPWTMSSLPSCFVERERTRGPAAELRARFPPARQRVRPGSVVRAGECTIFVGSHDLQIAREHDRLRVPPEAALYRDARGLTLVFIAGSRAEIRRY